jgi:hypothetical protein
VLDFVFVGKMASGPGMPKRIYAERYPNSHGVYPPGCLVKLSNSSDLSLKVVCEICVETPDEDEVVVSTITNNNFNEKNFKKLKRGDVAFYFVSSNIHDPDDRSEEEQVMHDEIKLASQEDDDSVSLVHTTKKKGAKKRCIYLIFILMSHLFLRFLF